MAQISSAGRVVVLNGASSAGKSTLANALQAAWEELGECWVVFSWDDFMPRLPARWHAIPGWVGDRSSEGCQYRLLREEPHTEALLEVGPLGWQMLQGYHRAIAALAGAGVKVIVEEVMITPAEWDDWTDALAGIDVRWVAVHCDVETLERRELERGDRHRGLARGTARVTHGYATYDVEVDTTSQRAAELARAIVSQLS
jgi:chloramphenicol 3-O phosphotransferase